MVDPTPNNNNEPSSSSSLSGQTRQANQRRPFPPPEVSILELIGNVFIIVFFLGAFATLFRLSRWGRPPDPGWTCAVGTAKFASFQAWRGSMGIQVDGGNCSTLESCSINYTFTQDGSVFMSRGCPTPEEITALETESAERLLWIMVNSDPTVVDVDCFVWKANDTLMSCSFDPFPNSPYFPPNGGQLPFKYYEQYRKTLCNSSNVKRPWWSWIPFTRYGLSCSSRRMRQNPVVPVPVIPPKVSL